MSIPLREFVQTVTRVTATWKRSKVAEYLREILDTRTEFVYVLFTSWQGHHQLFTVNRRGLVELWGEVRKRAETFKVTLCHGDIVNSRVHPDVAKATRVNPEYEMWHLDLDALHVDVRVDAIIAALHEQVSGAYIAKIAEEYSATVVEKPDVTPQKPDVTPQKPDVTPQKPDVTPQKPDDNAVKPIEGLPKDEAKHSDDTTAIEFIKCYKKRTADAEHMYVNMLEERNKAVQERDKVLKERDTVVEQFGILELEHDKAEQERHAAIAERDDVAKKLEALTLEYANVLKGRYAALEAAEANAVKVDNMRKVLNEFRAAKQQ